MRYVKIILIFTLLLFVGCSGSNARIEKLAQDIYSQKTWAESLPPNKFKSDGCSLWPDKDWLECCVLHDLSYWIGGSREDRKKADILLQECVAKKGHPVIGKIMYLGVRPGGVYWLPTPFRWGFGWDYPESGPPGNEY